MRLFVPLSESIAHTFAAWDLTRMWEENKDDLFTENNYTLAEIHALISAMKVTALEATSKCLHECRTACGGLGFSHFAGFGMR